LIRAFVNQDPAARARVEKDNSSRGLAPVHPLLAGSGAPDAALVQRLLKAEQESGCAGASAAAESAETGGGRRPQHRGRRQQLVQRAL
jgi:hypothetical protein